MTLDLQSASLALSFRLQTQGVSTLIYPKAMGKSTRLEVPSKRQDHHWDGKKSQLGVGFVKVIHYLNEIKLRAIILAYAHVHRQMYIYTHTYINRNTYACKCTVFEQTY